MTIFSLCLVSPDLALRHAVREQIRLEETAPNILGGWTITERDTLPENSEPPCLLVVDDAALKEETRFAPDKETIIILLGNAGSKPLPFPVTETILKPLRLGVLMTQLRFYRRVAERDARSDYILGAYRFSPQTRQLTAIANEEVFRLTEKEASLLDYLYRANRPVPRDELLSVLWGYDPTLDTHTLETHLTRLRRAVPDGQDLFVVERGEIGINPAWR